MKDEIEDEPQQESLAIKAPSAPPKPVENAIVPKSNQNIEGNIVPFEPNLGDEPDFDLMVTVTELEGQEYQIQPNTSNTIQQKLVQQCNLPMFAGCKIANITIKINKKRKKIIKCIIYEVTIDKYLRIVRHLKVSL